MNGPDQSPSQQTSTENPKLLLWAIYGAAAVFVVGGYFIATHAANQKTPPPLATSSSSAAPAVPIVGTCAEPSITLISATWRPPTSDERPDGGFTNDDFDRSQHNYLLTSVRVRITNHSPHKIWVRSINIANHWTDETGAPQQSYYLRFAGWFASVVPEPRSSNDDNDPRSVSSGDSIELQRQWTTEGFAPSAEWAITNGPPPVTTLRRDTLDWWLDNPDLRAQCVKPTTLTPSP